jgi:hypothetical protein
MLGLLSLKGTSDRRKSREMRQDYSVVDNKIKDQLRAEVAQEEKQSERELRLSFARFVSNKLA